MNLEEMLRQEREGIAPNPLLHRTDEIVTRVRRRRRVRAAAASVVSLAALVITTVVAGQFLPVERSPSASSPSDPVPVLRLPQAGDSPLDPARYVVSIADAPSAPLLPVLSVPEGFGGIEDAIGVRTDDFTRYLWVWDVDSVYTHPCQAGAVLVTVGPSVADLANALAAQPLRAGTDPVPVTVGGYDGLYVELSVPDDVDVTACPQGRFSLWPGRWQEEPGQVDMVWIVDVEGQRITFDASHMPNVSPDKVAELKDMVATATFAPAEGT
jgi:hypothetical protein